MNHAPQNWNHESRFFFPDDIADLEQLCEQFYQDMPPAEQLVFDNEVDLINQLPGGVPNFDYGPIPRRNDFQGQAQPAADDPNASTLTLGRHLLSTEKRRFGPKWALMERTIREYGEQLAPEAEVGGDHADAERSQQFLLKTCLLSLRCGVRSGTIMAYVPQNRLQEFKLHILHHLLHGELAQFFLIDLEGDNNTWPFPPDHTPIQVVGFEFIQMAQPGEPHEADVWVTPTAIPLDQPEQAYRMFAFRYADIFNNVISATLIDTIERVIPGCVVGIKPILFSYGGIHWGRGYLPYHHPMESWINVGL